MGKIVLSGAKLAEAILNGREQVVVGNTQVLEILPHRRDKLLIGDVLITEISATARFLVSDSVCAGHAVWGPKDERKEVFQGALYAEMAAQFLGLLAGMIEGFPRDRLPLPTEYGGSSFLKPTFPRELLTVEVKLSDVTIGRVVRDSGEVVAASLVATNFVAKVGDETRATVASVRMFAKYK